MKLVTWSKKKCFDFHSYLSYGLTLYPNGTSREANMEGYPPSGVVSPQLGSLTSLEHM